ncbi:hypothetical protein FHW69_000813 [Luteibacter sp. Sphag1AF]|uniref:DUF6159 family protein n=1 Tax=Luteibacter sp. Sphag1AF TaxID=2587031 RepID=UPI001609496B|nr:DUF6159 family protein [Luteibacter sp. Sphag1AF]MBB3226223.1 hypothetical protein [Luteibacter sp. Sphag1AF]
MTGKFARSWGLIKVSAQVLQQDKVLALFPLLSGICSIIVAATFFVPFLGYGEGRGLHGEHFSPVAFVALMLFYLVQYTIIFFFNTALVSSALVRLRGGTPTLKDGLDAAWARLPAIIGYALISATVGVLLRAAQERMGIVGRLVAGLLGLGWTVASFLVVPVLASQNIGPVDALKRSVELLRKTWGENLIGNGGLGLAFGLVTFGIFVTFGGMFLLLVSMEWMKLAYVVGFATCLALLAASLIQAALQGIYSAALYRYAQEGRAGGGFDTLLLEGAFRSKV